jgi:hypothetical protein
MRWIVLVCLLVGCGGPKIPQHSGYKNDKFKPWTKAKTLKLDEKGEGKSEGELDYAAHRRAKWYAINLPSHGELTLKLEITPPGDAVNEDFDLALEILDPGFRVISKSDLEEGDAGELNKTKTLFDLDAGKYLVHIYLQGRMDSADYLLRAAFKTTKPADLQSDFPTAVAFYPSLPMVPLNDEVPPNRRPKVTTTTTVRRPPRQPKPPPDAPAPTVLTARIVGVSVVTGGTRIVIGRGTATGAKSGMKAKLSTIPTPSVIECNENTCAAVVNATPDQIRGAGGSVTLLP